DPQALFRTLIANYCSRFNWAYFDRYDMDKVGQLGSGFSLILLHKYCDRKRTAGFYADKYFKAFPQLIAPYSNMEGPYAIKVPERCYSLRTFERFMQYFGLIHMEQAGWDAPLYISRTVLFDRLITCIAHKEA
ncbi:MAG TPA: hypothetical protein VFX43_16570, partial [Chitinophagaceae bacterium]|nr:hypothetical protein [Chitinophagaceae bacterium]